MNALPKSQLDKVAGVEEFGSGRRDNYGQRPAFNNYIGEKLKEADAQRQMRADRLMAHSSRRGR